MSSFRQDPMQTGFGGEDHARLSPGMVSAGASNSAPFTLSQIANQLTTGFWTSDPDGTRRFDVTAGDTLRVDLSNLAAQTRVIAQYALQAWTDVSGLKFSVLGSSTGRTIAESGDAPGTIATNRTMAVNQTFEGAIRNATDVDVVRVSLVAGQTYTISLKGRNGVNALDDAFLRVLDNSGVALAQNDDFGGSGDSQITFRATRTGVHYLEAKGFTDFFGAATTGQYALAVTQSSRVADITFDDDQDGAYSTSQVVDNRIVSSHVNISSDWDFDPVSVNSYWFQTYIHEIGHALGLGHAGNYNGTAVYGVDNQYANDSWQASVMSYFSQTDNTRINASFAYTATMMPADIIAIQTLYGTGVSTRAGNTVYGAHSNVTGYLGSLFGAIFENENPGQRLHIDNPATFTIYDTGGIDTVNFSTAHGAQTISLYAGTVSSVGGLRGNMLIARGTVIENAIGGSGNDRISGNGAANGLYGGAGKDFLSGNAGNDRFVGGAGNDTVIGGSGSDTIIFRGPVSFAVDLGRTSAQNTMQGVDRISGVENVVSGAGRDQLTGNAASNKLYSGGADDVIRGGSGDDTLRGDAGNDKLYGGSGFDTLLLTGNGRATVNLGSGALQNTGSGRDLLISLENVISGSGNDRLYGTDVNNILNGGAGSDLIFGGGGYDRMAGSSGKDTLNGGAGNDTLFGGSGADDFRFGSGNDTIVDFANNQDDIFLSRGLWGGGARTVAQMLDHASVRGSSVVFDFGSGNMLIVSGTTDIASLGDDLFSY